MSSLPIEKWDVNNSEYTVVSQLIKTSPVVVCNKVPTKASVKTFKMAEE